MTKLTINTADINSIDPRTKALRYDHPVMSRWLSTCQVWSWEGGDAIVVVTGQSPYVECWIALRFGDTLQAICANSIKEALAAYGYESAVA